jgi:hypothetical protein
MEAASVRKPVTKLTVRDLQAFPIWEYAHDEEAADGQDETWVRPVDSTVVPGRASAQLVAATFSTPAGRALQGFMVVTTIQRPVEIQPGAILGRVGYRVIPSVSRQQALHRGYTWSLRERERLLMALRAREADLFPLAYELRVPIRGERHRRHGKLR